MTDKEELIRAAETFVNCCNEHYLFKCPDCPLLTTCSKLYTDFGIDDFAVVMRNIIHRLRLSK